MNLSIKKPPFSRICYDDYQPEIRVISKFIRVRPKNLTECPNFCSYTIWNLKLDFATM